MNVCGYVVRLWGFELGVKIKEMKIFVCLQVRKKVVGLFAGAKEGSKDLEMCLPYEILEVIENDPEFMDDV